MHLKSLTLRGFKSFASATTLTFEPGITCVVGPNGSGKSNVVDALSWVLGEQGAKSLRGGKMEDVIFAGTAARAPLGRAEVVLTIDNADGALPIDYAEVTISRTMFRNGGSDYAINGAAARLLDVQELLSDSGIGREMHVIVGQGQLDSILSATPEGRRGFIEEAAGVLKHRKRKEKALRKLEACEGNLQRLSDLLSEIRRQLKPLGRQAEVARKAAIIQAEARDARARLLADDLVQATLAGESVRTDEETLRRRRHEVEAALDQARTSEMAAEEAVRASGPELSAAADTWYALTALRERVSTTVSIAHERLRRGEDPDEVQVNGDHEALTREADALGRQEDQLRAEIADHVNQLRAATARRTEVEAAAEAEERQFAELLRAAADRREGLARLHGQVNAQRSRVEAGGAEIGRLRAALTEARQRAEAARHAFTSLETTVAGLDAGELGLDDAHEQAANALAAVQSRLADLRASELAASQQRAALTARVEALELSRRRKDGTAAVLAAGDPRDSGDFGEPGNPVVGVLGSVAALVRVEPGYEVAVAAALGLAADAVAMADLDAAVTALNYLQTVELGRANIVVAGKAVSRQASPSSWPALPASARYAVDTVQCPPPLTAAMTTVLSRVVIVEDLTVARALLHERPELVTVTRDGSHLSTSLAAGGSPAQPSMIELEAALEDATTGLAEAQHACERLGFAQRQAEQEQRAAEAEVAVALAKLHESDAALAAVAEKLGHLSATARSAEAEAERLTTAISAAEAAQVADRETLAALEHRLASAAAPADARSADARPADAGPAHAGPAHADSAQAHPEEPDPAERDRLALRAREARAQETEARLALRTLEERLRALTGRTQSLRQAATAARDAQARAAARQERIRREATIARAVVSAGAVLAEHLERSLARAGSERAAAEAARRHADDVLLQARQDARALGAEFERVIDAAHRDELLHAEHRMRIEALTERARVELGFEPATLTREYGPDVLIPVLTREDGGALTETDDVGDPTPYVRAEQERRLRSAERSLALLGRVNPLALEEFSALEERHQFLAEQLDDLRRTRADLMDIITEVDARVEEVFAKAYADVAAAFERVFARLFPGGEGRLVLTEPGDWLTTGVEVEARPPGKKIKRLSLLSGGERSLVAVAFLVSLFLARPSPFYILDEVEAALDDTNLGRLLGIYEELRAHSQLLVITHQKRTMSIADALYGVTMRGDGVSTVISSRLREDSVA